MVKKHKKAKANDKIIAALKLYADRGEIQPWVPSVAYECLGRACYTITPAVRSIVREFLALPRCVQTMGCYCAGHATGNAVADPCCASERPAIVKLAPVTLTAAPVQHVHDTLEVTIEARAPRARELGWWVAADATPEQMLAEVVRERGDIADGIAGFGFHVHSDFYTKPENEYDSDGLRCVTVKVKHVVESVTQFGSLDTLKTLMELQGAPDLGKPGSPDGRNRRLAADRLAQEKK